MPDTSSETARIRCVVLAPRSDASSRLVHSLGWQLRHRRAALAVDLVALEAKGEYGALVSDIALQILRNIESADAVVADLTTADPNVMYEVGFAHALKKPVLPIVQKDSSGIPSDLSGYLFYVYNPDDLDGLGATVAQWLKRMFSDRMR